MKTSESILKISPALLEAQKKIGHAVKTGNNPFFHSTYASLGDVMEACKEALNENGITVLQPIISDETGTYVETVLLHTSGEWLQSELRIAPKTDNNPQDQGSAISYARRYALQSMVFIPAEDDDAEKAKNSKGTPIKEIAKQLDEKFKEPLEAFDKLTLCTCGTTNKFHRKDCPLFGKKTEG